MIWTTEKLNTFFAMKDQGYTLKEIAAELGCTYAAAQSKSHVIKKSKKESTKMENSEKNAGTVETPTEHFREVTKMVEPRGYPMQSEMLEVLKELSLDLLRYAAGSDSIVPGAYAEALDVAIETYEKKER